VEPSKEALWTAHYEKGIKPNLEYTEKPIFSILERTAKRYPQRSATYFNEAKMSYKELLVNVNRLATALATMGVKKGDRVGIILPNCPQAVISFYAIMRLGCIAVYLNPVLTERELTNKINDAGIQTLILIDMSYRKISNIRDKVQLDNLIVTHIHDYLTFPYNILYPIKQKSDGRTPEIPRKEGIYEFNKLIKGSLSSPPDVSIDPKNDVAVFQYTGGVTGTPKAAMITHFNLVANVKQFREWFSGCRDGEERIMGVVPFAHIYGLTCVMNFGVYIGATLILLPRFQVNRVLKTINKSRPTFFPGVPSMYYAINNSPDVKKVDISSIDYCISGAAPLPLEVQERFEQLTGARLVEGFGLTEASPVTHCNPVRGRRKVGSIGLPVPDTHAKIVDLETGTRELDLGDVGELAISGPQVMKGYWNRPEETEFTLKDGWLYTGDIAEMDSDGYFFILNRKKDMIISGGYNIYPGEVEGVLNRHPKVGKTVVVGIPDDYQGEVVKAYIFCKSPKISLVEDELKDYCLNKLAPYKIPKKFEIRKDKPPKNLDGAELRRYLVRGKDSEKDESGSSRT